jgi:hypothetical protein
MKDGCHIANASFSKYQILVSRHTEPIVQNPEIRVLINENQFCHAKRRLVFSVTANKDGELIVIGTIAIPHRKDKRDPRERQDNRLWSGKEQ